MERVKGHVQAIEKEIIDLPGRPTEEVTQQTTILKEELHALLSDEDLPHPLLAKVSHLLYQIDQVEEYGHNDVERQAQPPASEESATHQEKYVRLIPDSALRPARPGLWDEHEQQREMLATDVELTSDLAQMLTFHTTTEAGDDPQEILSSMRNIPLRDSSQDSLDELPDTIGVSRAERVFYHQAKNDFADLFNQLRTDQKATTLWKLKERVEQFLAEMPATQLKEQYNWEIKKLQESLAACGDIAITIALQRGKLRRYAYRGMIRPICRQYPLESSQAKTGSDQ